MSSKALMVALRALLSPKFWRKVVQCDKLADLYTHCAPDQVVLPDFVAQYEKELVSTRRSAWDGRSCAPCAHGLNLA
jgi:hypothetical protein